MAVPTAELPIPSTLVAAARAGAAGALVGGTLGLARAASEIDFVASLAVDHQANFVAIAWLAWTLAGLLTGIVAHAAVALGTFGTFGTFGTRRAPWPGWSVLATFLVVDVGLPRLSLSGPLATLVIVGAAVALVLVLWRLGRSARFLESTTLWASASFALALACAWSLASSPPAAHVQDGASWWPIAVPGALALAVAVRRLGPRGRPARVVGAFLALGAVWLGLAALERLHGPDLAPPRTAGPNVLLVTIDTLRADALGCYGNELARTPSMDALAAEGVLFEDAQSPLPMTDPSHTSILTGLYPGNHGVLTNMPWPITPGVETLPEIFARAGYRTAAFVSGFTLERSASRLHERFQLFDDTFGPLRVVPDAWIESSLPELVWRTAKLFGVELHALRKGGDRPAARCVASALDWLDGSPGPFFAWVHLFDPHLPYAPPPEQLALHAGPTARDRIGERWYRLSAERRMEVVRSAADQDALQRLYRAEVSSADHELGRLLASLRARGLLEDTLVVLTSDHGESQGEHDYWFDHGRFLYDTCLHVPLVMRLPESMERAADARGVRVSAPVRLIDVAPTVVDLVGLELPTRVDGTSLVPLVRGEALSETELAYGVAYDLRADQWSYRLSVRTSRWKYVRTDEGWNDLLRRPAGEELFDLSVDPGETRDVSQEAPAALARMRELARERFADWSAPDPSKPDAISERARGRLQDLGYF